MWASGNSPCPHHAAEQPRARTEREQALPARPFPPSRLQWPWSNQRETRARRVSELQESGKEPHGGRLLTASLDRPHGAPLRVAEGGQPLPTCERDLLAAALRLRKPVL